MVYLKGLSQKQFAQRVKTNALQAFCKQKIAFSKSKCLNLGTAFRTKYRAHAIFADDQQFGAHRQLGVQIAHNAIFPILGDWKARKAKDWKNFAKSKNDTLHFAAMQLLLSR